MGVSQENGIELAPQALDEWLRDRDVQLVDVREPREFDAGHVPGSVRIGFDEVTASAESFDKDRPLVIVCRSGNRSEMVADAFRSGGYDAYHVTGGLLAWAEAGLSLEPEDGEVAERSLADL